MKIIIEIEMTLKKSTKGTHVYQGPGTEIPSVYIRKVGLPDPAPEKIIMKDEVPE